MKIEFGQRDSDEMSTVYGEINIPYVMDDMLTPDHHESIEKARSVAETFSHVLVGCMMIGDLQSLQDVLSKLAKEKAVLAQAMAIIYEDESKDT
jgi:hypothetical protein